MSPRGRRDLAAETWPPRPGRRDLGADSWARDTVPTPRLDVSAGVSATRAV
ncbi:hypothetical protein [Cryobacterium glaciale]|uniref:hypothetical protein n=1 Tax=Cryobacterium glaciale TaxID=1259145 RepID=UPI00141BDDFC|nr:hypothetical protein [Cryobacterium glaciale]